MADSRKGKPPDFSPFPRGMNLGQEHEPSDSNTCFCGKTTQWLGNLGSHVAVKHPREFLEFMEATKEGRPVESRGEEAPVEEAAASSTQELIDQVVESAAAKRRKEKESKEESSSVLNRVLSRGD